MNDRTVAAHAATLGRVVRIMIGLVMLASAFVGPRTPLGWLGLLPLLTGITGGCGSMGCATGSCATRSPEDGE